MVAVHELEANEDLAAVHPEQDQPKDQQGGRSLEHGDVVRAEAGENIMAQVALDVLANEAAPKLPEAVEGDGIEPDDNERKGPSASAPALR